MNISIAWPWALLLLPLPLLLPSHGLRLRARNPGNNTGSPLESTAVTLPPALQMALDQAGKSRRRVVDPTRILIWIAWCGLVLALAQPFRPGATVVQPVSGRALALAIDLSSSMEREDFELDGISQNRLSVVKRVVGDFVEKRRGDRVALILFGREAFIASAPTFDLRALRSILDGAGIGMAGRSTAIGDALGLALQSLRDDPAPDRAVVLLSDGTNNEGSVEPESAAELASALGVRVHTVALASGKQTRGGLRTAVAADLDEETLKAIAETSGGRFFRATSSDELSAIYREIDRLESAEATAPPLILQQDLRWLPALVALIAMLVASLLPGIRQ